MLFAEYNFFKINFIDPASPLMYGIIELHDHIFFFLNMILFLVLFLLLTTLRYFSYKKNSRLNRYLLSQATKPQFDWLKLNHGTTIEIIWTVVPSVILVLIAIPSFALLYATDELVDPSLTVQVIGHQWYRSYEYNDLVTSAPLTPKRAIDLNLMRILNWKVYAPLKALADHHHPAFFSIPHFDNIPFLNTVSSYTTPLDPEFWRTINPSIMSGSPAVFGVFKNPCTNDMHLQYSRNLLERAFGSEVDLSSLVLSITPASFSLQDDYLAPIAKRFDKIALSKTEINDESLDVDDLYDMVFAPLQAQLGDSLNSVLLSQGNNVQQLNGTIEFDSYMRQESDLQLGERRLYETDFPLVLPKFTHIRFMITADDVIHSWSVPALGIKVDAVPGRINHAHTYIKYSGIFYGQCSELCGVNHAFMPIQILVFEPSMYYDYIRNMLLAK